MRVLVTGAAGFIGAAVSERLLARGDEVLGFDSLNEYYDVSLKHARLARLSPAAGFTFLQGNVADRVSLDRACAGFRPERIVHLAAQAGVRYSLTDPHAYGEANLVGFLNVLEACRHNDVAHLVYASSSSVYGADSQAPFSEQVTVDHPVSLYAATKKANELMAHAYSHLFKLPTTGLRFFTVYGPWGRPDMALFLFTRAILEGQPIDVFNGGDLVRDFTYVDDVVEGVVRVLDRPPEVDALERQVPYAVFNIGNGQPTPLMDYIAALEASLGLQAEKRFLPMQPGDVPLTSADTTALDRWVGYQPNTPVREGVAKFVEWYRAYYGV
ncbi:MAG: NAD-dependent epimerase [Acidobacteria bacterium]|nr:NAD-dependent epimerase [Acidobacteriota bacterium]